MQFSTGHAGLIGGYCTAINASTDSLTLSGLTIVSGKIYKAFFTKWILPLPVEVEEQTTYYLRISSSVIKIYRTLATAQTQTSPVDFATSASGTLFVIYLPEQAYPALTCWDIGAASIADIVCCPPVPSVYTDCPNAGSIVYGGATRSLKMFWHLPNGGDQTYKYGSLNSAQFTVQFVNPFTSALTTWNVSIMQFFKNYRTDRGLSNPGLQLYFVNINVGSFFVYYQANENTFPTTTYTQHWVGGEEQYFYFGAGMEAAGLIPSTLSVTFSGQVLPPPRIKVNMPDAYFENKAAPITLGLVEETLTYDAATLTYWSDLKTYAGIKGRLHFSIPNFYPLASSNIKYIDYGNYVSSGGFPANGFNSYSNDEFVFYKTVSVNRAYLPQYYWEGDQNLIQSFTASDEYGGYPTGLGLGETWLDTRVIRNYDPDLYLDFGPEFIYRIPVKIVIAFSKWASGKFLKSNALGSGLGESPGDLNHYHQSAYFIQSDHAGAYVSSLEV